jgi:hypothetical protein
MPPTRPHTTQAKESKPRKKKVQIILPGDQVAINAITIEHVQK